MVNVPISVAKCILFSRGCFPCAIFLRLWSVYCFNTFVKKAAEAMKGEDELEWTFLNSCAFVFAALTTVGKLFKQIQVLYWIGR